MRYYRYYTIRPVIQAPALARSSLRSSPYLIRKCVMAYNLCRSRSLTNVYLPPNQPLVLVDTIVRPIIRILLTPIPLPLLPLSFPLLNLPSGQLDLLSLSLSSFMILHYTPYCRFELFISPVLLLLLIYVNKERDLLELGLIPFSFLVSVVPLGGIHLDFQRSVSLDSISATQLHTVRGWTAYTLDLVS